MKSSRDMLKHLAKLAVGFGLVAYVLNSKMIDFSSLKGLLFSPKNLFLGLGFCLLSTVLCSLRWFLLTRAQSLTLSFRRTFALTMIGNFFNTFMPGSVGGDVVKAWYVAGHEPNRKTKAIFTVLLDRVIGLSVIVFYAAFTLLFYLSWIEGKKEIQLIAYTIWFFTFSMLFTAFLFYTPFLWKFSAFNRTLDYLRRWSPLEKIIDASILYRHHLRSILFASLLSSMSVFGMNLFYKIQGDALGLPMDLPHYFFIVPISLVASAVPILPGGLGVGQVAFYTLFKWMNMPDPDLGGTLCTAVQIYNIIFNCFGALFYLRMKRVPKNLMDDTSQMESKNVTHVGMTAHHAL